MNLKGRISKLETRRSDSSANYGTGSTPREWERYFHLLENARRELRGDQLKELEYTEEDYESDMRFLNEAIPHYRDSEGWQTDSAREMLASWEREVRDKMEIYRRKVEA